MVKLPKDLKLNINAFENILTLNRMTIVINYIGLQQYFKK